VRHPAASVLSLVAAMMMVACSFGLPAIEPNANPIVLENRQPGSTGWRIGVDGFHTSDDVLQQIEGYASTSSVNRGEPITFYITVNPPQAYTIDVYRIGWYGGTGGRLLQHVGPMNGAPQANCPIDASTGLRVCSWVPSYMLTVADTWTTGIYLAVLTSADRYQSYIIFTVRDDGRKPAIYYQQPVNTYQAYNNWPDDNDSGKSLYTYNSYGPSSIAGDPRAVKVSFDRPYSTYNGAGQFLDWEVYLVHWLERSGYDVSYSTDIDSHSNSIPLLNSTVVISAGHDEYWTRRMYDAVESARDGGVNLAFLGANALYWQARLEPSAADVPNRVLVCYRDASLDPNPDPGLKTVNWRSEPVNRPEQELIGVQFTSQLNGTTDYVATDSSNWVYAGSGFDKNASVADIVGYEVDRNFSEYPQPPFEPGTFTLLSQSQIITTAGYSDWSNASIYRESGSGAWVFATGTMSWSWALDRAGYVDRRVQKTTANVLNRLTASSR
jgi:hypothetical protein